ncbi:hypothetical protein SDJN03_25032, partial [Cucurbita argyrosperma subsp. sororia]
MSRLKRSEVVLVLCLTLLLLITPLLSSSLRPTYLYFVFNLLILGLLSSAFPNNAHSPNTTPSPHTSANNHRALEKAHSDNIPPPNPKIESLNKCPSASTIFFIGDGDSEEAEEEASGGAAGGNGQDLFAQAETFIGNFYKQLEMQKQESWKNVHGFYRKPF